MAASVVRAGARIRALVLDFNGTLAQDGHLIAPIYADIFASLGLSLSTEDYHRELAAMPDRDLFETALARAGLPADAARRDALVRLRRERYAAAVASEPPIDDHARAFVRAAAARVPLAIASGAFRAEIERALHVAGMRGYFAAVVSVEDVTLGKPDPEGFLRALERLNEVTRADPPIAAHETAAVEDATAGARAARAAGMAVAAIRGPGYEPASGHADLLIDRLEVAALAPILALSAAP